MLSSESFTEEMLSNPALLGKAVIDMIEASDTSGELTINDPNNGFIMNLFSEVAIYSKLSQKIDYLNSYFYKNRARNAEQLYAHISEFDYVNLMASPATLPFYFAMSKDWIINNAVEFDDNYNKIQIPSTSYISMGGVVYSMYYPIDILVNRNTSEVTAFYNTDVENELYTLESNMLLESRSYTQNGINYFQIKFNMFQFNREILSYTVGSEQGFNVFLPYDDQFYAVKVFNKQSDGTWKELSYSLSKLYYDYQTPTALINLMTDSSRVNITIPQIYFHNGQITKNIKVELYTTKGAINYSLTKADLDTLKDNFDTRSSVFAAPLEKMPTYNIIPGTSEVQGGSDSKTYSQMRDAVVNDRLYSRAAVTSSELIGAGLKAGFNLTRYVDDLTERIYFASNVLTDSSSMAIPTFVGSILLSDDIFDGDPSSIINYSDGYKTILPTTIFKISPESLLCIPLKDGEIANLSMLNKQDFVDALNDGSYVRQPFHITLLTTSKSPRASIYNLLSPSITNLVFEAENSNSAPQMSILSATINHQNDGTGGYHLLMSVERSTNIKDSNISNFHLYLTCKSKIGESVYIPATYVGPDSNGDDVWEIFFSTNYHITIDNHISVMMYNSSDILSSVEIELAQSFSVVTSFDSSFNPNIIPEAAINAYLPNSVIGVQTAMSNQTLDIEFGTNLSQRIYCGVNTSWGNDVFDVADETIYFKTNVPIYQTNEDGIIETRISGSDTVEIVELHPMNSTPPSESNIVYYLSEDTEAGSGGAVLNFDDTTGILVGMRVWGENIQPGSVVTGVTSDTVTLDLPAATLISSGTEVTFLNSSYLMRVSADQITTGNIITVSDTSNLIVGMTVFGFGIGDNNIISSIIDSTTFSLENDTTEAVLQNTLLTIKNMSAHGVVKIAKGEILTDSENRPIVVKAAANQYRIPTILFDGRLFESDLPDDQVIVTTISQRLQNFANQIGTIDEGLLESSDVYYKPVRTMGPAMFGIGNEEKISLSLELTFNVSIYIDEATYNTPNIREIMEQSTIRIISEQIQNPTISSSLIGQTIKQELGNSVSAVEVDGINGDNNLRFVALLDKGAACSIATKLILLSDGTVDRIPGVSITFIAKPVVG